MSDVEKPAGFDLRDKRSDKSNRGGDWSPADALFDASRTITDETKNLLVVWFDTDKDGKVSYRRRFAGEKFGMQAMVLAALADGARDRSTE